MPDWGYGKEPDEARLDGLAEKAKAGTISPDEVSEATVLLLKQR